MPLLSSWGDTMAKLYFIRRTLSEIEIFGGTVFVDIDGKRVGEVGRTDLVVNVESGQHTIKMYKSHTYDTFIGFAEVKLDVEDDKTLVLRYSAPMVITQSGHIVVTDFVSIDDINRQIDQKEAMLQAEKRENDLLIQKQEEESKKNNNTLFFLIIVVPIVIGLIYFFAEMTYINSLF